MLLLEVLVLLEQMVLFVRALQLVWLPLTLQAVLRAGVAQEPSQQELGQLVGG